VENEKLLGRWESRGGKYWVELHSGYFSPIANPETLIYSARYSGADCGGSLSAGSDHEAMIEIERRIAAGYFQADANKTPMRRVR
jgi:hypothetical protein